MKRPPARILAAIWATAALALLSLALSIVVEPEPIRGHDLVVAPQLLVLLLLARRYPVNLGPRTKTYASTAILFAIALLLPPYLGITLAAACSAVAELSIVSPTSGRRPPWFQILFNTAGTALSVATGALVFEAFADMRNLQDIERTSFLIAATLAALAIYLVNNLVVDGLVGLQLKRSPLRGLRERWRFTLPQEGALFLLGLLVAVVAVRVPPAVLLLIVPSVVVYRSLRDGIALRVQTREALLELADVVDMRDHYTYEHSRRVAELARRTAELLGLTADQVEIVEMAGRVHDVGKIGIKSTVLLKPGGLSEHEWREMRSHPELGARLIARFPQFDRGKDLVLSHHERYDGKGYPRGLAGDQIPLGARILAVADAWDAMTSHRAYRDALDVPVVYAELERGRNRQFDPRVLDAFLRLLTEHPDLAVPHLRERQEIDAFERA